METAVDPLQGAAHGVRIGHIRYLQLGAPGQVVGTTAGQIVKDANGMTVCHQRVDQVGSDKTGATCHQIPGHLLPGE